MHKRESLSSGRFGAYVFEEFPLVVAPISDDVDMKLVNQMVSTGQWPHCFEIRLDLCASRDIAKIEEFFGQRIFSGTPLLLTIRSEQEGGKWSKDDEQGRLDLFQQLMPKVEGLDIELSSLDLLRQIEPEAAELKRMLVVSHHNFSETPPFEQLVALANEAQKEGASVFKVATMVNNNEDVKTLLKFLLEWKSLPTIVIGMGPKGRMTRIFFPLLGSVITFASLGKASAPGQFTIKETGELLDFFRKG